MGYSHYFTVTKPVPAEAWDQILDAVNNIVSKTDVPTVDGRGRDEDDCTTERIIHLNGLEDDGYETFFIDPDDTSFNFCKTFQRPYDIVVVAILCTIQDICGECFDIKSDGDAADWVAGSELATRALRRPIAIPAAI